MINELADDLKKFFKEEKLSDRILRIVEIDENFCHSKKRKHATGTVDQQCCKRLKQSFESILKETDAAETEAPLSLIQRGVKENQSTVCVSPCNTKKEELCDNVKNLCHQESAVGVTNQSTAKQNVSSTNLTESNAMNNVACSENAIVNEDEVCHAEFPVHSIVLCINSQYFKTLLVDSGMKETTMPTVSVKVSQGKGRYLEMLIEAFYNREVLKNASLADLLNILDIAARFSCLSFIKYGLETLNEKSISTVDECDAILQHISKIFEVFNDECKYHCIKETCVKFLTKTFFPLEFKLAAHDLFKRLNYATVVYLLTSSHAFTLSENNTFVFIYLWLLHNKNYQTSDIIEVLITSIHYESLSSLFLCDQLSNSDQILSKWTGYSTWLINVLKYHSLTPAARSLRGIKGSPTLMRLVKSMNNALLIQKHFVYDQENFGFCDRSNNFLVWNGLQLSPVLSLKCFENNNFIRLKFFSVNVFSPTEQELNFYHKFDIYYSLLPGNINFKNSMLDDKRFVQRFVRKGEVQFKSKCTHSFHAIARIEEDFMASIEHYGLNLVLFFKTSTFSWNKLEICHVKPSKKLIYLRELSESS